jgi:hypothetical protein
MSSRFQAAVPELMSILLISEVFPPKTGGSGGEIYRRLSRAATKAIGAS